MTALPWLLAGVLALPASAAPTAKLRVEGVPVAGKPFTATATARRNGKPASGLRLRVLFTRSGRRVAVAAHSVGRGRYRVRAVLGAPGRWRYDVRAGRRSLGRGSLSVASPPLSRLSGAAAFRVCAGAGPFWPTMTLAVDGAAVWVACKENGKLQRVDAATGTVRATIALPGSTPIAVVAGLGSIWALDGPPGTLYRIDPATNRVAARNVLGVARPYNLWIGAGSVWSVDDSSGDVLKIDPVTLQLVARIPVGDGPADLVFQGTDCWVINHRDLKLVKIDTRTSTARTLAVVPGDAPERMAWAAGWLWITGRGTGLIQVDPATGAAVATVGLGPAGGIDVIEHGGALWVPARASEANQSGFPRLATVVRVDPTTRASITVASASGRLDVHGLAAAGSVVWLADNTNGVLYRLPG